MNEVVVLKKSVVELRECGLEGFFIRVYRDDMGVYEDIGGYEEEKDEWGERDEGGK